MGLDEEQVNVLKRCFDGFADEDGAIPAENVGNILSMMGLKVIYLLNYAGLRSNYRSNRVR